MGSEICDFIPNSPCLPLWTARSTEAESRHQFRETIKNWWRTHPALPGSAGVPLSAGKNEFLKAGLRVEAAVPERNGVNYSAATWLTFTRMVLQDEADDAMTERVIRTFAFQHSLKKRAAFVVRRLITLSKLPQAAFRDDFDLGNLSRGNSVGLSSPPFLHYSQAKFYPRIHSGAFIRCISIGCLVYSTMRPEFSGTLTSKIQHPRLLRYMILATTGRILKKSVHLQKPLN